MSAQSTQEGSMAKIATLLKESQAEEKKLYTELKVEADNVATGKPPTMSEEQRDELVSAINYESEKRRNYYELVKTSRAAQVEAESMAAKAARQQILTLQYLESNLDSSKKALNALVEDRQKKMKMVEINTYFGKQFEGYALLLRGVALVAASLLILYNLKRRFEKFALPIQVLESAVMYGGGIYVLYLLYDTMIRRNDNYDEYTFPLAPTTEAEFISVNNTLGPIIDVSGIDVPSLCAGSYCCGPGTTWSDASGCVFDPTYTVVE